MWQVSLAILNQASHTFMWASGVNVKRVVRGKARNIKEMEKLLGIDP